MAEKTTKIKKPSNDYKATDAYKTFMPNSGLLSEDQHDSLLKGESSDLKKLTPERLKWCLDNELITKT